jgi:hypothetical protein
MDEGFNTYIDLENAADYFRGTRYGDSIEVHPLHLYPDHAVPGTEQPLINRPVEQHDLFWTGYQKPALMMRTLREEVLGPGMDLDWFWRDWIYTTARLDQAVDSLSDSAGRQKVWLSNRGSMTMPAELELTYADSSSERVQLPVEMWNLGPRFGYRVRGERRVVRAELDPRRVLPDIDRSNNRRER